MPETSKDPGMKLFGMTIQLPEIPAPATEMDVDTGGAASAPAFDPPGDDCSCLETCAAEEISSSNEDEQLQKNEDGEEADEGTVSLKGEEESMDEKAKEMRTDELKAAADDDDDKEEVSRTEEEEEEEEQISDTTQDKNLKKPDKIIPCPRCNSMDTKFCYFNNYNVNQPRHFCKNCQRYWTSGGTMRNMAIGAGRRKGKNLTSHSNGKAPTLNTADNSSGCSVSAATTQNDEVNRQKLRQNYPCFNPQFPCFPVPPQPYFCPGFNMPFYPAPTYWACPWNVSSQSPPVAPNSPALGKHSRDENKMKDGRDPDRCLWVPKTLRINDPEDAAKSSIWAALGIRNDRIDSINGGAFKAFKMKDQVKSHVPENCTVLEANPAALSRSLNFHESS